MSGKFVICCQGDSSLSLEILFIGLDTLNVIEIALSFRPDRLTVVTSFKLLIQ